MLDEELLEILACPETKEPVAPIAAEGLAEINRRIAEGKVINRGGEKVEEPLEEALLRQDGRFLYPVRDGIPIMLVDEGIACDPA